MCHYGSNKYASPKRGHMSALHVQNEIGKLKRVLLHCPGPETCNYPDGQFNRVFTLRPSSNSFDLEKALREHHAYSAMLEHEGVEILYLENLLTEALMRQSRRATLLSIATFQNAARGALSSNLPFASILSASKAPVPWLKQRSMASATPRSSIRIRRYSASQN